MATDDREFRALHGVHAATDPGSPHILGIAIAADRLSQELGAGARRFRERIPREAIAAALAASPDVIALRNHDDNHVLGRTPTTLQLWQDDHSGDLRFRIDPPVSERGLVESIDRGDLRGASFGFTAATDQWDFSSEPPIRTLTSFRLHEISVGVAWPAYPASYVAVAERALAAARNPVETPNRVQDGDSGDRALAAAPSPEPKEFAMPSSQTRSAPLPAVSPGSPGVTGPPDPLPPVPPVVTTRAAGPDAPEVRVLAPDMSVRSWVEARTGAPPEYKHLRLGDVLRAMITGPRSDLERRALSEGTDAAGGFTVPDILMANWIDRLRAALVVVRAGATTVPLSSDSVRIARLATDPVAAWRSENAAVAESDPTFESVTFTPRSLDVFFKTSRELLEDSINAGEILETALVRSFAVEVDRVCLHGTGTAPQPRGLRTTTNVNEVSQGVNGAALTSYDPLIDLLGLCWADNVTVDPVAIVAPRTLTTISKFKEATTNAPLARPAALTGWSFLTTALMPINETQGGASTASSLFIGDWSEMMLGFRTEMQVEVARELYRGNYQYGFFGHLRFDMQVTHPESFGRLIGIIP